MATILQWNCQGVRKKLAELDHRASGYHVIVLVKTWLKDSDRVSLRGFDVIRHNRSGKKGGGVTIFIRTDVKYQEKKVRYKCNGQLEVCGADITIDNKSVSIIGVYKPP